MGVPNPISTQQKGILLIGILVLFVLTGIAFEDSEPESVDFRKKVLTIVKL
jgi:hypothetical protein